MSNIKIEKIFTSDNIKQFMEKCNNNFASIAENGGGPRGESGQNGATGATGKRGSTFHFIQITEPVETFGPIEATAAIENNEDIEDGDFVFFFVDNENKLCYGAYIEFEETSEGYVPVITDETLVSLQGIKGEQGVPGDASTDQFEADGDGLTLRNPFQQIILPKPNEGQLLSTPSSTLCIVKGGIGFVSGNREKSSINGSNDNGDFTISSELNMSLASKENITIGEYGNGVVSKNTNITGDNINITRNGSTNRITINQTNVGIYGKTKFDNDIDVAGKISSTDIISSTQKIISPSIETNDIKVTGLSSLDFVQINSNDGFNVGNVFKINPTNKKINITSNVDSTQPIKAKVGNDVMELGVPKYTFMLYPKSATTPSGWCEFSNILMIPVTSEVNYGTQSSYQSRNKLWFKYKVSTTTSGSTTGTMKYVEINMSNITQATFDVTKMSSVNTTTSSVSGSVIAESYTNVPYFVNNDTTVLDYEIDVGDNVDLPWTTVVTPNNILYIYRQLIKHMLTNKGSLQDMSGIFSRIIVKRRVGNTYYLSKYYTLFVPEKSSMFKWIFKIS